MAGNELALVGGEINASTVSEALTLQLEDTLLRSPDAKTAAKEIAGDPKLLAEARDRLNLVSRLAAPIGREALYVAIQPLLIMFGPPDFGQDEEAESLKKAWFDLYAQAMADRPREAVEIAVAEWLRVGKPFFPKATELNALAEATAAEIQLIAYRLRRAVERANEHRPTPKKTPEEALAVKQMVEDMKGPDGRIQLAKSMDTVVPPSNRKATAEALRRMADYQ